MFNRQPLSQGSADDLNTAARIRDAAIEVFGEQGFQVGVRVIAKAADVSPGLVNHHFGSKDGLRAACDERVLQLIRDEKLKAMNELNRTKGLLSAIAEVEVYGPMVAYLLRTLQAGGPAAISFFDHLVDDTVSYIRTGVDAGTIRPSRDEYARARYLTMMNVGAGLLWIQLYCSNGEKIDFRKAIRDVTDDLTMPALEMYTQGIFTDSTLFDALTKEE
ncbi:MULTISPECIES: TetR/AcrR family transcriptional regulator [unclassified Nocardia]|uniref:TetR/AcrR family transcriptional regulator n=1 Tax=unclassified Nocardia TaxID=2637762 RepID=UPI001CE40011|nr:MULTISPECIES: TetR family transcriptional regulator [unclassified Nocardia]